MKSKDTELEKANTLKSWAWAWLFAYILFLIVIVVIGFIQNAFFPESDAQNIQNAISFYDEVKLHFWGLMIFLPSAWLNWRFDKKYEEDPFLWVDIRPTNIFEKTLCVFGGVVGAFTCLIIGVLLLAGFLALFGIY